MESTGFISREALDHRNEKVYGPRLSKLVAEGNDTAVFASTIIEMRDNYRRNPVVDLADLAIFEYSASLAKKQVNEHDDFCPELYDMLMLAESGMPNIDGFVSLLVEGNQIDISSLAADAIKVQPGVYIVLSANKEDTVLTPIEEGDNITLKTKKLVENWRTIGRVLLEKKGKEKGSKTKKAGLPALRRARQKAGMSLKGLADKADLGLSTLSKIELGHATPAYGTMEKIMDALGVDPSVFHVPGSVKPYGKEGKIETKPDKGKDKKSKKDKGKKDE